MADDSKMDDLLESLTTSTRISLEDDDVSLIHPRYLQYYKPKRVFNQEERRRQWLLEQKEKRLDSFIVNRGIEEVESETSEDESEPMIEGGDATTKKEKRKKERAECPYKNWLMLSYWLVDVPENFESEWYYLLCPKGRRSIVIASKGSTIAYSRRGAFMMKFPSALPGGNSDSYSGYTVIDCIYNFTTKTFYILDVLIWGIPLTNCSAELRFFWLSNKFIEHPELCSVSKKNRHNFAIVRHELVENLAKIMLLHPMFEDNSPQVDGLLFYQKESLYTGGKSPLVVWLKPFMVKDILSMNINENYLKEIPLNYANKIAKMDTDPVPEPEETPEKLEID